VVFIEHNCPFPSCLEFDSWPFAAYISFSLFRARLYTPHPGASLRFCPERPSPSFPCGCSVSRRQLIIFGSYSGLHPDPNSLSVVPGSLPKPPGTTSMNGPPSLGRTIVRTPHLLRYCFYRKEPAAPSSIFRGPFEFLVMVVLCSPEAASWAQAFSFFRLVPVRSRL